MYPGRGRDRAIRGRYARRVPVRVAFFRGINVGGHGKLPMAELRALLGELGLEHVKTYVQSGNAVFRSGREGVAALAARIADAVEEARGFRPAVLVRERRQLESIVEDNPLPDAVEDPKLLHVFLLDTRPRRPDLAVLASRATRGERFELRDRVFYLHTPGGFSKSKVPERVEKALGVTATGRNWRTMLNMLELARSL